MSTTYTVTLTELEDKAVRWAERDPQKWLEIVVKNRANVAAKEIYSIELKKALDNPDTQSISSDIFSVVLASTEPTAQERHARVTEATLMAPPLDADAETHAAHAAALAQVTSPQYVGDTPRTFLGGNI
jgi:hypothetical protein